MGSPSSPQGLCSHVRRTMGALNCLKCESFPKGKASCSAEQGPSDLLRHLWGPPGIWSESALEKLTILALGSWRLLVLVALTADCPRGPRLLCDSEFPTLPLFFSYWESREALLKAF